jgi:Arc/MetJ-type ribon-helix-helix transcriptional regulator
MVKIEVEIPADYVKFIEEFQRFRGEPVSVAEYIQGSIKCLLEGEYCWMCDQDGKKADQMLLLLESGEAVEA